MDKPNTLVNLLDDQFNSIVSNSNGVNILIDHSANEWMEIAKKLPNPAPLFGNIWHQGEVAILFSNTGKGKSIFAVQLADCITNGKPIISLDVFKQIVIYFDFELSTKAFQRRYSEENGNSYCFSEGFIRVEIDRKQNLESSEKSFEELIIESIKYQVQKHNAQVVLIDNITYLSATNEKSKEALLLMKLILDLSRKEGLAILLIAHTPKRDIFKPIQLEDLAGSKALSNFCDTVFCIGESAKGSNIRYLKQLKNRNYPIEFNENNVIECELVKENSFVHFKFTTFNTEDQHLKKINELVDDRIDEILEFKKQGLSNVKIAKHLSISEGAVRRRMKKHDGDKN